MMHAICNIPKTRSVSSTKMINSVDNTITILVKLATGRSFCLLPAQLLKVVLQSLYGRAGKNPGISKTMQEICRKCYFPSIEIHVRNWARECEQCIQDKRINRARIVPELIHSPGWDLEPDLMQINLLPEIPPSGC